MPQKSIIGPAAEAKAAELPNYSLSFVFQNFPLFLRQADTPPLCLYLFPDSGICFPAPVIARLRRFSLGSAVCSPAPSFVSRLPVIARLRRFLSAQPFVSGPGVCFPDRLLMIDWDARCKKRNAFQKFLAFSGRICYTEPMRAWRNWQTHKI